MKNFSCLLCALSLIVNIGAVTAQEEPSLKGKVVDGKSNEPVSFATVRVKNKSIGVISNLQGDFQLPARLRGDTVLISCIGYVTKAVALAHLSSREVNTVKLEESVGLLSEVRIKGKRSGGMTPYKIVKTALKNIKANYPIHPFSYDAYYRDYQIADSQYVNLNEAVVQVNDMGFGTNDQIETKLSLYEYRQNNDFKRDSLSGLAYDNSINKFIPNAQLTSFGGNELTILRVHDPIRNSRTYSFSFVSKLSVDFLSNHTYAMMDQVFLDSVPLYCVQFVCKPEVSGSKHFSQGKLFIEHKNFAIHKLEYATYEKEGEEKRLLYDVQVEYSRRNSSMYLNYISFNNLFKIKNPRDFSVVDVFIDRSLNAFVVQLNHPPDPASVYHPDNYQFRFDDKPLAIRQIRLSHSSPQEIVIFLRENNDFDISSNDQKTIDKVQLHVNGIRDLEGREVNVPTFISINQFRELFVQKMNVEDNVSGGNVTVDKGKPLQLYRQFENAGFPGYWMNTPLKSNH